MCSLLRTCHAPKDYLALQLTSIEIIVEREDGMHEKAGCHVQAVGAFLLLEVVCVGE